MVPLSPKPGRQPLTMLSLESPPYIDLTCCQVSSGIPIHLWSIAVSYCPSGFGTMRLLPRDGGESHSIAAFAVSLTTFAVSLQVAPSYPLGLYSPPSVRCHRNNIRWQREDGFIRFPMILPIDSTSCFRPRFPRAV